MARQIPNLHDTHPSLVKSHPPVPRDQLDCRSGVLRIELVYLDLFLINSTRVDTSIRTISNRILLRVLTYLNLLSPVRHLLVKLVNSYTILHDIGDQDTPWRHNSQGGNVYVRMIYY